MPSLPQATETKRPAGQRSAGQRPAGLRTAEAEAFTRRQLLAKGGRAAAGLVALSAAGPLRGIGLAAGMGGADLDPVNVAYAGSMGSFMEGSAKPAVARSLRLELRGHGQGANGLAQLIMAGSLTPDVFLSVTPGPMQAVLGAGKAAVAVPVAATRMVIAYSAQSRFAARLEAAREGKAVWWQVLEEPGLRFGRSDPATDPQGRNILFAMMLAAKKYNQPDLVEKILGPTLNPRQISMETGVQARLQAGELDAASAYRIQPEAFHLPFLDLPHDIDLSGGDVHARNPEIRLTAGGRTFVPEPLVFYAAPLKNAANPVAAEAFVHWLGSPEGQSLLRASHYDEPGSAPTLRA